VPNGKKEQDTAQGFLQRDIVAFSFARRHKGAVCVLFYFKVAKESEAFRLTLFATASAEVR